MQPRCKGRYRRYLFEGQAGIWRQAEAALSNAQVFAGFKGQTLESKKSIFA
jgi:hypothetical protein